MPELPLLTLAHSGDPDDVFMWWPLTGKVRPDGSAWEGDPFPRLRSSRFRYRAVPGDIAEFNREAARNARYDITALSVRAYADVADRYVLTSVGSSFGEGYGPKIVVRSDRADVRGVDDLRPGGVRIAVPGLRTSAFAAMALLLGDAARDAARFIETPFDSIIPAVVRGEVDAGLVIHEGQVTYQDAGLRLIVDLGRWWMETRGLALPLGVNAVKRDLDSRFGAGAVAAVAADLRASLAYALAHRAESIDCTMPFAAANAGRSGTPPPTRERVAGYVDMYVTGLTVDMGEAGREAIRVFLGEGAAQGLCPACEIGVV